jgi:hypothetical protein
MEVFALLESKTSRTQATILVFGTKVSIECTAAVVRGIMVANVKLTSRISIRRNAANHPTSCFALTVCVKRMKRRISFCAIASEALQENLANINRMKFLLVNLTANMAPVFLVSRHLKMALKVTLTSHIVGK